MIIRPLQDKIVVRRAEAEEKTPGGIIIPDTAKEKPQRAHVVAVGNGKVLADGTVRPLDVRAGNQVYIGKWSGTEIILDGEDLLIIREEDVLGVVE